MTWVLEQQLRPFGRTSRPSRHVRVARSTDSIQLFLVLTNLAAFFIDLALLDGDLERIMAMGGGGIVGLVWALATIVPALAVLIRRLHDTDKSGWWVLIGLVPFVGGIVLLVFTLQDSTPGDNKHGGSPKALQG